MNRLSLHTLILLLALSVASMAHAQSVDGGAYFSPITDNVQPLIYGNLFSKPYLERKSEAARAPNARSSQPGAYPRDVDDLPSAGHDLSITFDPAISAAVRADYVASIARSSGDKAAAGLDGYYRSNDARSLLGKAMAPYGLRTNDFSDITTAYFVVMWMTANDAALPSPQQVRGVQAHMRQVLLDSGSVPARAAQRQRTAESLIYQTVTLLRVRETAQAQGNQGYLSQLADSAQASMAAQRFDLRGLLLTEQGVVQR